LKEVPTACPTGDIEALPIIEAVAIIPGRPENPGKRGER